MSKNVNVNGVDYSGVSEVQLKTADGGTALFRDVDEIVTPSGAKTIIENGTYDVSAFASAIVNVEAINGGSMESGTIVGDGTKNMTIPATRKHCNVIVWNSELSDSFDATTVAAHSVLVFSAKEGAFTVCAGTNYNATAFASVMKAGTNFSTNTTNPIANSIEFLDTAINIANANHTGGGCKFINGDTYNWIAW